MRATQQNQQKGFIQIGQRLDYLAPKSPDNNFEIRSMQQDNKQKISREHPLAKIPFKSNMERKNPILLSNLVHQKSLSPMSMLQGTPAIVTTPKNKKLIQEASPQNILKDNHRRTGSQQFENQQERNSEFIEIVDSRECVMKEIEQNNQREDKFKEPSNLTCTQSELKLKYYTNSKANGQEEESSAITTQIFSGKNSQDNQFTISFGNQEEDSQQQRQQNSRDRIFFLQLPKQQQPQQRVQNARSNQIQENESSKKKINYEKLVQKESKNYPSTEVKAGQQRVTSQHSNQQNSNCSNSKQPQQSNQSNSFQNETSIQSSLKKKSTHQKSIQQTGNNQLQKSGTSSTGKQILHHSNSQQFSGANFAQFQGSVTPLYNLAQQKREQNKQNLLPQKSNNEKSSKQQSLYIQHSPNRIQSEKKTSPQCQEATELFYDTLSAFSHFSSQFSTTSPLVSQKVLNPPPEWKFDEGESLKPFSQSSTEKHSQKKPQKGKELSSDIFAYEKLQHNNNNNKQYFPSKQEEIAVSPAVTQTYNIQKDLSNKVKQSERSLRALPQSQPIIASESPKNLSVQKKLNTESLSPPKSTKETKQQFEKILAALQTSGSTKIISEITELYSSVFKLKAEDSEDNMQSGCKRSKSEAASNQIEKKLMNHPNFNKLLMESESLHSKNDFNNDSTSQIKQYNLNDLSHKIVSTAQKSENLAAPTSQSSIHNQNNNNANINIHLPSNNIHSSSSNPNTSNNINNLNNNKNNNAGYGNASTSSSSLDELQGIYPQNLNRTKREDEENEEFLREEERIALEQEICLQSYIDFSQEEFCKLVKEFYMQQKKYLELDALAFKDLNVSISELLALQKWMSEKLVEKLDEEKKARLKTEEQTSLMLLNQEKTIKVMESKWNNQIDQMQRSKSPSTTSIPLNFPFMEQNNSQF